MNLEPCNIILQTPELGGLQHGTSRVCPFGGLSITNCANSKEGKYIIIKLNEYFNKDTYFV